MILSIPGKGLKRVLSQCSQPRRAELLSCRHQTSEVRGLSNTLTPPFSYIGTAQLAMGADTFKPGRHGPAKHRRTMRTCFTDRAPDGAQLSPAFLEPTVLWPLCKICPNSGHSRKLITLYLRGIRRWSLQKASARFRQGGGFLHAFRRQSLGDTLWRHEATTWAWDMWRVQLKQSFPFNKAFKRLIKNLFKFGNEGSNLKWNQISWRSELLRITAACSSTPRIGTDRATRSNQISSWGWRFSHFRTRW